MNRPFLVPRAILLIVCLLIVAHFLSGSYRDEAWQTSITTLKNKWQNSAFCNVGSGSETNKEVEEVKSHENVSSPTFSPLVDPLENQPTHAKVDEYPVEERRANAAFVFLARNSEMRNVIESLQQMEDRFNKRFKYPYVFLNDEPFTEEFKELTSLVISSSAQYGVIPREHWHQPDWIDEKRAKAAREQMVEDNIIYGGSVSYRNMCRFNSGFFFRHELMLPYRWYWRIEPGVRFYCDITEDPFLAMQDNNQAYGFNIAMYEYEDTVKTLWKATKEFIKEHPQYVSGGNSMNFISSDGGNTYNLCHFWSNFEIADMEFWRGEAYTAYFDWLESKGGFYYERWGDAPVHSIAAALFLRKEQIRFFDEIGYRHEHLQHCPSGETHKKGKCSCVADDSFDWDYYSCLWEFARLFE